VWSFRRGFLNHITLSVQGRTDGKGKFDWGNAIADAGILSGITCLTGVSALVGSHAFSAESLLIVLSATGIEFLTFLALKRGLVERKV